MGRVRHAFTLVEMLVAVGLVILMMTLFATVFHLAVKCFEQQRSLAECDESKRRLSYMIRTDLQTRTFRHVVPLRSGIEIEKAEIQRGYMYISENDPLNDCDDVLALTTSSDQVTYGKALILKNDPSIDDNTFLRINTDQPEADDGLFKVNAVGASTKCEVCYFVRNGTLYRRCLLIREPFDISQSGVNYGQPKTVTGEFLIPGEYNQGSNVFWRDFDYAAYNHLGNLRFHDIRNSLDNTNSASFCLGSPRYRFGFDSTTGKPREYVSSGSQTWFIGRFTLQETSHEDFQYPGKMTADCPLLQSTPLEVGNDGVITKYNGTHRIAEDILIFGVDAFDIKVFDDDYSVLKFVDVGHSLKDEYGNLIGFFNQSPFGFGALRFGNQNPGYGPKVSGNRCFDTWHPQIGGEVPFRLIDDGEDARPGKAGFDDNNDMIVDNASEYGYPGTDDNHPLRAIQITIRFHGPDGRSHQTTITESLIDR